MSIRARILLGMLLVVLIGLYNLLSWIVDDLKPEYRKSTEEPLVDAAQILASIAKATALDGEINVELFRETFEDVYSRSFSATIYDFVKEQVDYRVYITDRAGIVIFDSWNGGAEGEDYSEWHDVHQTLVGEYGARTSRDLPENPMSSVMYVASPIVINGEIVGVLSVGKPTATANEFVEQSRKRIIFGGIIAGLLIIVVAFGISGMIVSPIRKLTEYAKSVRDGKRVLLPQLGGSEVEELGKAFEQMRDALDGKQYVENYVTTLTHEVKSPLSAIHGAAELLKEEMPAERRAQFLDNIHLETDRIKAIVDKLLLLSSLEARKGVEEVESINVYQMLREIEHNMEPLLEAKGLSLAISGEEDATITGERFLIRHSFVNLIQNAIDFSPPNDQIIIHIITNDEGEVHVEIIDNGTGIPDYAQERVYERFYSLKRPDTGKKSSGLGLSLVREVAMLHQGSVELRNGHEKGTIARVSFPRSS